MQTRFIAVVAAFELALSRGPSLAGVDPRGAPAGVDPAGAVLAAAATRPDIPHVRPLTGTATAFLADATRRSSIVKGLVERLGDSDVAPGELVRQQLSGIRSRDARRRGVAAPCLRHSRLVRPHPGREVPRPASSRRHAVGILEANGRDHLAPSLVECDGHARGALRAAERPPHAFAPDVRVGDWLLGQFIVARWGLEGLVRLIRTNGNLPSALGVDPAEFEAGWRAFLHAEYGRPA